MLQPKCPPIRARAEARSALLQGLTGVCYDPVDKTQYIDLRIGDSFRSFLATQTGFGTIGFVRGRPFPNVRHGRIDVEKVNVSGRSSSLAAA